MPIPFSTTFGTLANYNLVIKLDGKVEAEQILSVVGSANQAVRYYVTIYEVGSHNINSGDVSKSLQVTEPLLTSSPSQTYKPTQPYTPSSHYYDYSPAWNYSNSDVDVRGYYRKDGTYVKPYSRTKPDGIKSNNYGYPGNYNPNTGEISK